MMSKMTINLTNQEIRDIITEKVRKEMPGFIVKTIRFNINSKGTDIRNESYGYELSSVDVVVEKAL